MLDFSAFSSEVTPETVKAELMSRLTAAGLDIDTRAGIFPIFREVKREKAVLLITHDPEEAEALADHLVKIEAIPAPGNSGPSTPLPESR